MIARYRLSVNSVLLFAASVPFAAITRISTAAIFWGTDHDLVEHCICGNYLSITGFVADTSSLIKVAATPFRGGGD